MTIQCDKCNASKFKKETKAFSCGNGKYKLDILPPLPQEFNALYSGNSLHLEHFLSSLRKYNCAFQITFFGCKETNLSGWNPNFRFQGQDCYLIGSLAADDDQNAAFLQIYFLDESDQIRSRMAITDNLRPEILLDLQQSLHVHNIYVRELKSAYEYVHEHQLKDFNILIVEKPWPLGEHARLYNAPTCKAILTPNEPYGHRDIIRFSKSNQLKRICELHQAYDALQYPLLFPTGNDGWILHLKATKKVSQLQFYLSGR